MSPPPPPHRRNTPFCSVCRLQTSAFTGGCSSFPKTLAFLGALRAAAGSDFNLQQEYNLLLKVCGKSRTLPR